MDGGWAVHLGFAPNVKNFELVISFAEFEAEMRVGRDAEFELEMSSGPWKFLSSSLLLCLSSVSSFILILFFCVLVPFLNQVAIQKWFGRLWQPQQPQRFRLVLSWHHQRTFATSIIVVHSIFSAASSILSDVWITYADPTLCITFLSTCLLTPPSIYALTASIFWPYSEKVPASSLLPCLMREMIRFFSPIPVNMLKQIQVVSHRTNVCFVQEILCLLHFHPELLIIIIFLPSIHPIHNQIGAGFPAWIPNLQFIPLLHYVLLPLLFLLTFLILFLNFGPVFCHLVLFFLLELFLQSSSSALTKLSHPLHAFHHLWQPLHLVMRLSQLACTTPALRLFILSWFPGCSLRPEKRDRRRQKTNKSDHHQAERDVLIDDVKIVVFAKDNSQLTGGAGHSGRPRICWDDLWKRCAWNVFAGHRWELTCTSHRFEHRMKLFQAVALASVMCGSETRTVTREHQKLICTAQRRMLRLKIQTLKKVQEQSEQNCWRRRPARARRRQVRRHLWDRLWQRLGLQFLSGSRQQQRSGQDGDKRKAGSAYQNTPQWGGREIDSFQGRRLGGNAQDVEMETDTKSQYIPKKDEQHELLNGILRWYRHCEHREDKDARLQDGRPYCRQYLAQRCTCNDVFCPTTPHHNTALELGALCYHAMEDTNNRFNDVFWTWTS